ncbi:hypothetical protein I3U56_21685 [Mycobacteroides abscessus subsp. abscessus]|uniref:hypothetical protein n=1 Tax=Mycobacteroides abscessus TaxID=36809 RepID=UPI0019CFCE3B|nr:hypothetical protein [Mycobacteroides abscessus]MBN7493070.1 hypothetical protein [Mycobacteroides abscessus subsp. abscessus]
MAPTSDIPKPHDDPYSLVGDSWPQESEGSYRAAEVAADDAATAATTQGESSDSAAKQTDSGMQGKTADSVSGGYEHLATQLHAQSQHFTAISGWMLDAGGKVQKAKSRIANLVRSGTSEIRNSFDSELRGTPASPSSAELTTKYRADIAAVKSTLDRDLDAIGHSLTGDPGSSTTPSYTSVPTAPSAEHPNPTAQVAAYNHGQAPEVTPHQLPEMPRATASSSTESTSAPTAPAVATPHSVNPTLSNLISGSGSPSASSPGGMGSPHASSPSTPSTQAHRAPEHHQDSKPPALPRIPNIPLDGLPAAAAESIATAVSSAAAHQLPTTTSTTITPAPSIPASTGITPGVPGTPPVTPVTPTPLTPIGGGGGLATPAVTQPAPQAASAAPSAAPQQTTAPSPPRSPAADLSWIQRTYGLAPGIDLPKSETVSLPARFITDLPAPEAHLHRVLATIRQAFETSGWSQPLAAATIRKGFETRCVYVTSDGVSIHPQGVLLPHGVTPLSEMPGAPACSELAGSLMVTEKLKALIPRGWEVEGLLSTVPADEHHQSTEHYQELVGAGELLECKVSRGREGVTAEEAMAVFARAAIGSGGCSDLDVESARLRAARWVGVQPSGYLAVLARWHLSDAAESMSRGAWGEAVYASKKYQRFVDTKYQAA